MASNIMCLSVALRNISNEMVGTNHSHRLKKLYPFAGFDYQNDKYKSVCLGMLGGTM
jgi:hypothetical protein